MRAVAPSYIEKQPISPRQSDIWPWWRHAPPRTLDVMQAKKRLPEARVKTIAEQKRALESGFQPAFFDFLSQTIYISVFADGTPAPFHVLEGLPRELIIDRARSGRVVATKATLLKGYERNGYFYTTTAAARAIAEWSGVEA